MIRLVVPQHEQKEVWYDHRDDYSVAVHFKLVFSHACEMVFLSRLLVHSGGWLGGAAVDYVTVFGVFILFLRDVFSWQRILTLWDNKLSWLFEYLRFESICAKELFVQQQQVQTWAPFTVKIDTSCTFGIIRACSQQHPQYTHNNNLRYWLVIGHVPLIEWLYWVVSLQCEPRLCISP